MYVIFWYYICIYKSEANKFVKLIYSCISRFFSEMQEYKSISRKYFASDFPFHLFPIFREPCAAAAFTIHIPEMMILASIPSRHCYFYGAIAARLRPIPIQVLALYKFPAAGHLKKFKNRPPTTSPMMQNQCHDVCTLIIICDFESSQANENSEPGKKK